MTDPYYQVRLREAYWYYPQRIPLYQKATYIYAVAQTAAASSEPNPSHVILYSTEWRDPSGAVFPYPTPESKRIEVYYALAAGTKGLAYWWFPKASSKSNGLSGGIEDGRPEALALWREMGLLGNEIKTAAPLLVTSCPIAIPTQPSAGVWARMLSASDETAILLTVNDQYSNDEAGCHYSPVAAATVNVTLPSWLVGASAFEITAGGILDAATQPSGSQLLVNLGTLNLTRMIVITRNAELRGTLEQRYDQLVRSGVCGFAPEVCTQNLPPVITQQPQFGTVCGGLTVTASVSATGSGPLAYQWQKDQANLADGGRISGTATGTLTLSGITAADAGNYRCVVSNAYGTSASGSTPLTVLSCIPGCLTNLGFEAGFTNGIGKGWIKFLRVGTVTCSEETTEAHGGTHSQEIYSPNKNNDGGVYQQFLAMPGQPYTVKAWIKVHSPQQAGNAEGFFGIDPTGGTDPNSSAIMWASKPWEYWSQDSWTVTAQSTNITVYLRGRSTRLNQTAYVWVDDIELAPGSPVHQAPLVLSPTSIRWRWTDLSIETGYRVRDAGEVDKSGLLPPDTIQWLEATGLLPNTAYTRHVIAINDCGVSDASASQTARTLSLSPGSASVVASTNRPAVNEPITWTAQSGFGAGTLQYYRYAWDQEPAHTWTDLEPQWAGGTIVTAATAPGTWYLHVQGYNADNIANGGYDYDITTLGTIPADFDRDNDVDSADFDLFTICLSGPDASAGTGCNSRDLDHDNDVDQSDFGLFQRCFSGENLAADAGCAD
jgi:hypothetical protein